MKEFGIDLGIIGIFGVIVTFVIGAFCVNVLLGMFSLSVIIFLIGFGIYETSDNESEEE